MKEDLKIVSSHNLTQTSQLRKKERPIKEIEDDINRLSTVLEDGSVYGSDNGASQQLLDGQE